MPPTRLRLACLHVPVHMQMVYMVWLSGVLTAAEPYQVCSSPLQLPAAQSAEWDSVSA